MCNIFLVCYLKFSPFITSCFKAVNVPKWIICPRAMNFSKEDVGRVSLKIIYALFSILAQTLRYNYSYNYYIPSNIFTSSVWVGVRQKDHNSVYNNHMACVGWLTACSCSDKTIMHKYLVLEQQQGKSPDQTYARFNY